MSCALIYSIHEVDTAVAKTVFHSCHHNSKVASSISPEGANNIDKVVENQLPPLWKELRYSFAVVDKKKSLSDINSFRGPPRFVLGWGIALVDKKKAIEGNKLS